MRVLIDKLQAGIQRRQSRRAQMFFMNYDLDKMVPADHVLRLFKQRLPVEEIAAKREEYKKSLGREGYGMELGLRALFLQFWGDYSDREMEERLRYDVSYRWFCGLKLEDTTPDHSFFCRVRKTMGAEGVGELFERIVKDAELRGVIKKVESFVDASAIRRKEAQWQVRDERKLKEEEEIKNDLRGSGSGGSRSGSKTEEPVKKSANTLDRIKEFSADIEARWGCKGGKKYWFGYKRHVSMDMGSELLEKIWVSPANVNDHEGFKYVCPSGKRVLGDKGYDTENVRKILKDRNCKDGVIRMRTRKDYDKRRNKILTKKRSPGEHVFSKMSKRTRYMGLAKTYLQALMEGIVHNLKRLAVLEPISPLIGLA